MDSVTSETLDKRASDKEDERQTVAVKSEPLSDEHCDEPKSTSDCHIKNELLGRWLEDQNEVSDGAFSEMDEIDNTDETDRKYTPAQKLAITQHGLRFGYKSASKYFTGVYGHPVSDTIVSLIVDQFCAVLVKYFESSKSSLRKCQLTAWLAKEITNKVAESVKRKEYVDETLIHLTIHQTMFHHSNPKCCDKLMVDIPHEWLVSIIKTLKFTSPSLYQYRVIDGKFQKLLLEKEGVFPSCRQTLGRDMQSETMKQLIALQNSGIEINEQMIRDIGKKVLVENDMTLLFQYGGILDISTDWVKSMMTIFLQNNAVQDSPNQEYIIETSSTDQVQMETSDHDDPQAEDDVNANMHQLYSEVMASTSHSAIKHKALSSNASSTRKKRGSYTRLTGAEQAEIAKYAKTNNNSAAVKFFSKKLGKTVSESTVRGIRKRYDAYVSTLPYKKDVAALPIVKCGRPPILGDDMHDQLIAKLKELRDRGESVNTELVIHMGRELVEQYDSNLLVENGGPLELTITWAKSVMNTVLGRKKNIQK